MDERLVRRALRLSAGLSIGLVATATAAPRFSVDIVPVFNTRCVACHLTGDEPGRMALTPESAYSSLVGVPSAEAALLRVKPGDPDASYLVKKIEGQQRAAGGIGERMPFGGPALDAETIAAIRAWIAAGAKND